MGRATKRRSSAAILLSLYRMKALPRMLSAGRVRVPRMQVATDGGPAARAVVIFGRPRFAARFAWVEPTAPQCLPSSIGADVSRAILKVLLADADIRAGSPLHVGPPVAFQCKPLPLVSRDYWSISMIFTSAASPSPAPHK